jgi:hypothetical protein
MEYRDVNPTQGFGATDQQRNWEPEETYWRDNWSTRGYASADRNFDYYRPAYRYGFDSAHRYADRHFNDVESDLRTGWNSYPNHGERAWDQIKDAVRDAWDRVRNR